MVSTETRQKFRRMVANKANAAPPAQQLAAGRPVDSMTAIEAEAEQIGRRLGISKEQAFVRLIEVEPQRVGAAYEQYCESPR